MLSTLFTLTIGLSAALLFCVQPLVGRLLLPMLGGVPAVWNTCLVFFQLVLLAGYLYAYGLERPSSRRLAAGVHLTCLLLSAVLLPLWFVLPDERSVPTDSSPVWWLLTALGSMLGLPLLVLSGNASLLQVWFSRTRHPHAADPYFLFAASNAGSLLGLLAYPLLIEPSLPLTLQRRIWTAGYLLLALCVGACWLMARRNRLPAPVDIQPHPASKPIVWQVRLRWMALAAAPSSLLIGTTAHLTTDVASVPLLWVVPLMLYLLTFMLAFARRDWLPRWLPERMLPVSVIAWAFAMLIGATDPISLVLLIHLAALFVLAAVCHYQLAADRPAADRLTEFYLWLTAGGALGGACTALAAPLLLDRIWEYPAAVILTCLLRRPLGQPEESPPAARDTRAARRRDIAFAAAVGAVTLMVVLLAEWLQFKPSTLTKTLLFGPPVVLCYLGVDRPLRFALSLAAVLLAATALTGEAGRIVYLDRSFFGVLKVTEDETTGERRLVHGRTLHGRQSLDPERRREPLSYFHRLGPAGELFDLYHTLHDDRPVAVIGLGTGSLAAYALPDERWTFYEIDPAVAEIAARDDLFSYLADSRAARLTIELGDARLRLAEAPDNYYGLLVIDAFSSDAIPLHLLTREAFELYRAKLRPDGWLGLHVSNRYLDLESVLGNLSGDMQWTSRIRHDLDFDPQRAAAGWDASQWVVMARDRAALAPLVSRPLWRTLQVSDRPVWTDDYANLRDVFRWQ